MQTFTLKLNFRSNISYQIYVKVINLCDIAVLM